MTGWENSLFEGIAAVGLTGAVWMTATVRGRAPDNADVWTRFRRVRRGATGALLIVWFAAFLLLLEGGWVAIRPSTAAGFGLGTLVVGLILPMVPLAWRFGRESLRWSRHAHPATEGLGASAPAPHSPD